MDQNIKVPTPPRWSESRTGSWRTAMVNAPKRRRVVSYIELVPPSRRMLFHLGDHILKIFMWCVSLFFLFKLSLYALKGIWLLGKRFSVYTSFTLKQWRQYSFFLYTQTFSVSCRPWYDDAWGRSHYCVARCSRTSLPDTPIHRSTLVRPLVCMTSYPSHRKVLCSLKTLEVANVALLKVHLVWQAIMPGDTLEFISALLLPDASLFELSVPVYKEQASFP